MEWTEEIIEQLENELTEKQKLFCKYYVINFNATEAAKQAGYSKSTAAVIASENLNKPNIQHYLQYLVSDRNKRLQVSADRVVQELAKVAFQDVTEFLEMVDTGEIKLKDLKEVQFPGLIKSIKLKQLFSSDGNLEGYLTDITLNDKMKALELLGKHTGAFTENLNLLNNGGAFNTPSVNNNFYINHRKKGEELT